jgi:hypothetical protein
VKHIVDQCLEIDGKRNENPNQAEAPELQNVGEHHIDSYKR